MMNNIIKLRAHHVLCLAFFEGKGYSDKFTCNMRRVLELLKTNPELQIIAGRDIICAECPNLKNGACVTPDLTREYDNKVLSHCGLTENAVIKWNDFAKLAADNIINAKKREQICGNCQWNEICKSHEE